MDEMGLAGLTMMGRHVEADGGPEGRDRTREVQRFVNTYWRRADTQIRSRSPSVADENPLCNNTLCMPSPGPLHTKTRRPFLDRVQTHRRLGTQQALLPARRLPRWRVVNR